jgi:hypothetical protein
LRFICRFILVCAEVIKATFLRVIKAETKNTLKFLNNCSNFLALFLFDPQQSSFTFHQTFHNTLFLVKMLFVGLALSLTVHQRTIQLKILFYYFISSYHRAHKCALAAKSELHQIFQLTFHLMQLQAPS